MKIVQTFLIVSIVIAVSAGCKRLPPYDTLSSDFVVYTKYDTAAVFSSYKTFAIKSDIEVITGDPRDSVWNDQDATSIINEVIKNMTAAGYVQVAVGAGADLGIQVVGIRNTTLYAIPPGYWWGYPGWGGPCYWGYCGGYYPYYPYYYTVSVSTGTLIVETMDLKDAHVQGKLNIIWDIIGNGQIGSSSSFIVEQCLKTVDQGFLQSPYVKAN